MEVLKQTQFGNVSSKFDKLPPFLAKKLQEAIVAKAVNQNKAQAKLEDKMKRAEEKRNEQLSL